MIGYIAAVIIGMNMPKTYTVERLKTYNFPIETVWKELSTVETYNEWKRDVNSVEYISHRVKSQWSIWNIIK